MRALRLALLSTLCLACSDSTGISLQGPSFMRVRVNGSPVSWGEQDSFLWGVNGPALVVQAVPGTLLPAGNRVIGFQIGDYRGPGTYALEQNTTPGPVSDAFTKSGRASPPFRRRVSKRWDRTPAQSGSLPLMRRAARLWGRSSSRPRQRWERRSCISPRGRSAFIGKWPTARESSFA